MQPNEAELKFVSFEPQGMNRVAGSMDMRFGRASS